MPQNGVYKMKDNLPSVLEGIRKLANTRVMVGIPGDNTLRQPGEGGGSSPINNATLAYIHENGAPEAHIPPRPFLKPAVEAMAPQIEKRLRAAAEAALKGNVEGVDKQLNALGLEAQAEVRKKINEGIPPPLAESTLRKRRAHGRAGEKPLVDTGQLRNAITYVIRKVRQIG